VNGDFLDLAIQHAPDPETRAKLEAIRADRDAFNARMKVQDMIVRLTAAGVILLVLASLVYMVVLLVQAPKIQKEPPRVHRPVSSAAP
jgi:hypothetical protein